MTLDEAIDEAMPKGIISYALRPTIDTPLKNAIVRADIDLAFREVIYITTSEAVLLVSYDATYWPILMAINQAVK